MSGQDMRLFVLWPQTHLIHVWQPVELGWCARLKSASWQYRFSSQGGSPSTLLLPSSEHQDTLPPAIYPTAELQQTCDTYYSYRLTVRYRRHGLHVASVSIEQMPHISLTLSLKVEPDLLHVLSVSSKLLSVPRQPLSLSWRLQPLTPRTLAYKLVDTQAIGGWLHSYSSFTLQSNFCAVPTPRSLGEVVVASIYFHVDGKKFEELTGELHLLNGTLSLTAGRETPTHVSLHPGKTNSSTYIFRYNHRTFYTTNENNSPISTDGPNTRTVFYQHKELSYLLSIEFVAFQWYKFNMYLYMNQKRTLFRSLAERDLEVHVFSSSRPSFLQSFTYLVWFIPVQHPMLQCEWTFHLQLFGTQKDRLLQNSTYTYNDHIRNATRFVRRSALPFDPEKYTGFVAKVNCTRSALTPALLRVRVNNYAAKTIEAPVACQKEACYIDTVWIQRPVLHTSILRQKRGTSFYLFVRLLVDCNIGISIKPLWRIYLVQDTTTIPDWSNPINSSLMYGIEMIRLTVPSFTLDYGLYLFYFTVAITPIRTTTVLRGSDKVYIQIESTDLVANIAGGTFRTVGFSDNWTLDGSASYDPDSQEGLKGITFTWYCTKEVSDYKNREVSPGKRCHPSQRDLKWLTPSGPVQVMQPESLPGNAIYYFRLVIQKDRRRSYADQTVDVQPGSPLLLDVACLENCGSTLIPTERFTLSGKCLNCRMNSQPVYYWSLFSENSTEISFDWSSRTSTGRYGAYLSIHALTFTKTAYRSYILRLKVTTWDGRSSIYRYAFKVNSPPRAGKCTINPHWGTAFLTKFVVQCSGFSDSNLPLTYKVIVASNVPKTTKITSVEENTFGTILYFGYQPKTPPSFLPVGVPSEKYALTLYVQVRDSLGAFTQVSLYVRVQNPVNSRPLAVVFHELLASVNGLSAPMTSYLQTGDYFSAGYLAYLAASVLNYIKAAPTLQLSKAQFRESLIKTALNISVESTMEINQVVASLSQVTEEADEVNIRSQDLAIRKLTEVTGVLKIQRSESHWSEEAEIQTSGILRCLSNILKAALLHRRNVNVSGVKQVFSIMENLTEIVFQGKVPGETETLMETKHWNITLKRDETWNIANAFSIRNTCRNCFYPSLKKGNYSGLPHDAVISTAVFEFDENPFPWLGYTSEIATMVLGFKMAETKANGDLLGIVPEGAEITIARKDKESSTFQLAMGPDKTQAYTTGGFSFEVNRNTKSIYIQILTKLKVTFKTSLEWLLASAISFVENVFLLSILKISFFSAMNTIRPKYCENITWLTQEEYSEIKLAKETMSADEMREVHLKLAKVRGTKQYKPLEADEIANMLKRAKIKVKAFIFTKSFISHLVFLTLLLNFAYSTENAKSFHYNQFIYNQFSLRLSSVDKLEHIYGWVKDLFLPLIHNDIQPTFLPESWSKIIGLPRMRQVRAKGTEKKCFHPHSFGNNFVISKSHCLHKYGTDIPEKGDYAGAWTKVANQSVSKDARSYGSLKMDAPKEAQPTGEFTCQLCSLTAPYTYYGQKPPNTRSIVLLEESYVMKDPFTPDKDKFLILGSHCSLCSRSVCVGTNGYFKISDDLYKVEMLKAPQ
ncbi:polycystic kidney disease and receptor for egg jelly-related protein [Grus japonensis]|uniref:Polycystic kidney disease and receptor for egg jelly-related protein n=1 Tax=Grus japonensis TaxID=30415 RepID=A0ABC9VXM4_GRUJA